MYSALGSSVAYKGGKTMSIIARIGERVYEFNDLQALNKAREIYASCVLCQNGFEAELEEAGVDFLYDFDAV